MLFSVLTLPFCYTCVESAYVVQDLDRAVLFLCATFATMGVAHLFRAFRLRETSAALFIAHLLYGAAFIICAALLPVMNTPQQYMALTSIVFWLTMIASRVLDFIRVKKLWRRVLNVATLLLILPLMVLSLQTYSTLFVAFCITLWVLLSVMGVAFARIRLDVIQDIVRKTYAVEIISGLMLLILAFSYVLKFSDTGFATYQDALWYCFAVVTTIGFGDMTPTTGVGRIVSVILGVYGIIVVALVTSIIVNFYGEMKKDEQQ